MKGRWTEILTGHRNREAYKATVVKQERIIQDKDREIARLKRQLAAIEDFCRRSLA